MDNEQLQRELKYKPLVSYQERKRIPSSAGVYIAWIDGSCRPLYVGKSADLRRRIVEDHYSGQRSKDHFCLLVYDTYLHEERCRQRETLKTDQINELVRDWIREKVTFQCLEMEKDQGGGFEKYLRNRLGPILNPLGSQPQAGVMDGPAVS
jgi:hypothetical protein